MTTATAPAVEKRKKPWTKARVIDLIIDMRRCAFRKRTAAFCRSGGTRVPQFVM